MEDRLNKFEELTFFSQLFTENQRHALIVSNRNNKNPSYYTLMVTRKKLSINTHHHRTVSRIRFHYSSQLIYKDNKLMKATYLKELVKLLKKVIKDIQSNEAIVLEQTIYE